MRTSSSLNSSNTHPVSIWLMQLKRDDGPAPVQKWPALPKLHRHRAIDPKQPRINEPLRRGRPAITRDLGQMPFPCRASAADAGPTAKQQLPK